MKILLLILIMAVPSAAFSDETTPARPKPRKPLKLGLVPLKKPPTDGTHGAAELLRVTQPVNQTLSSDILNFS